VTGNIIAATPVQQQTFNNGGDGLWRWMPSINVDAQGNMAIGRCASSTTVNPGIRYAGRLASDSKYARFGRSDHDVEHRASDKSQYRSESARWGDYSSMFVDPE
jgi:hypothetical protein